MAGGWTAVVLTPVAVAAAGFGAGGITAGSLAAKAMSFAWTTGLGTGGVATLQSLGAAGLTMTQSVGMVSVGGIIGAVLV